MKAAGESSQHVFGLTNESNFGKSSQHVFGLTNESSWEIIPACSVTDSKCSDSRGISMLTGQSVKHKSTLYRTNHIQHHYQILRTLICILL